MENVFVKAVYGWADVMLFFVLIFDFLFIFNNLNADAFFFASRHMIGQMSIYVVIA